MEFQPFFCAIFFQNEYIGVMIILKHSGGLNSPNIISDNRSQTAVNSPQLTFVNYNPCSLWFVVKKRMELKD